MNSQLQRQIKKFGKLMYLDMKVKSHVSCMSTDLERTSETFTSGRTYVPLDGPVCFLAVAPSQCPS